MGVFIREKHGRFYLDIVEGRRHHWRALGVRISKNPDEYKKQRKLVEAVRFKAEFAMSAKRLGVEDMLEEFDGGRVSLLEHVKQTAEKSGAATRKNLLQMAAHLAAFDERVTLGGVKAEWVEAFQHFLEFDAGLAQGSALTYATALRYAMNRAVRDGLIKDNPCTKVRNIKADEVDKPVLSAEELLRLENTECKGRQGAETKRAFLFACNTGLRVSDLQTLKWGDIEKKAGEWILRKNQVKTGSVVEVVLNDKAVELIGANRILHFASENVFDIKNRASGDALMKTWARAAGVEKNISWHTARRTFATLLLEAGTDVFTTQRLMGHTKIEMTSRYAKSSNEIKAQAVKNLNELTGTLATDEHEA